MSYFFPFSAVNINCVQAPFISISKEIVLDNVKLLLRKKNNEIRNYYLAYNFKCSLNLKS